MSKENINQNEEIEVEQSAEQQSDKAADTK